MLTLAKTCAILQLWSNLSCILFAYQKLRRNRADSVPRPNGLRLSISCVLALAAGLGFGALNESVRKQLGVSSGKFWYDFKIHRNNK